jgi:hypothetical protein
VRRILSPPIVILNRIRVSGRFHFGAVDHA